MRPREADSEQQNSTALSHGTQSTLGQRFPFQRRLRQLIVLSPPDILAIVRNPRPGKPQPALRPAAFCALCVLCQRSHKSPRRSRSSLCRRVA